MKNFWTQLSKLSLITIIGLAGSMTVGLMMHGVAVLVPTDVNFAYVAFGASGAIIFAVYHIRGLSQALIAALVLSTVQLLVASASLPFLNALIWSFGVNLPVVWLAFLFERKLAVFHWGKFIIVAIVYGVMFVLLTLVVGVIRNIEAMPAIMFRQNFVDGFLIGLGMGLGIQAAEAFIDSLETPD